MNAIRPLRLSLCLLSLIVAAEVNATDQGHQERAAPDAPANPGTVDRSPAVKKLRRQALKLRKFVKADWVRAFLKSTRHLPNIEPRTLYYDRPNRKVYSEAQANALPEDEREGLTTRTRDCEFYYNTKHGTPLAYARALDVLAAEGFELRPGMKIVDYGYGSVGHLRMLASLGAEVVGIEVDPELQAIYSYPGDQGEIQGVKGVTGSLELVHGFFPAGKDVRRAVGKKCDLFMSKNVLKNGYIHPARPPGAKALLDIGMSEEDYVQTLFDMLKPGGYVLIYNICPPESGPDEEYIPWSDGRSPFSRKMYEAAGFRVLVFDRVDTKATRKMAKRLGWNKGPYAEVMKKGLFAWYTILEKPEAG